MNNSKIVDRFIPLFSLNYECKYTANNICPDIY